MKNRLRKRLIDAREASREGRRFCAFYRGCKDWRAGRTVNPYPPGGPDADCWKAGQAFAEWDRAETATPPVCRLGPGGDFVKDWPEGTS